MLVDDAKAIDGQLSGYKIRLLNQPPQGIWELKLGANYKQFLATLNSKTRKDFRRKIRRFEAAFNHWEIKKLSTREDVAELISAQQYVYQRSWKSSTREVSRKGVLSFSATYLQHIASRGWLRGYVLYCNEIPTAYSINFQYRNYFYGQEMAYDKHYSKLTPGTVLVHEIIKDLHQVNPPKIMNFGFGDSVLKKQFCQQKKLASDAYLVRRFTFASGIIEIQYLLSKLYHRFHRACLLMNIDSRLRKIVK